MNLTVTHAEMYVDDQDKALAFYTGVLGLRVHTDVRVGDYRWLTVAPPAQPELQICLTLLSTADGRSAEDVKLMGELVAKGLLSAIIFQSQDVDADFERVRASGADIMQEPIDQGYGVRDCAFRDPAGNHLRLSQPLASGMNGA